MRQLIEYACVTTHITPNGTKITSVRPVFAPSITAAHAAVLAAQTDKAPFSVYPSTNTPDGIARAALYIACSTAKNAIIRQKGDATDEQRSTDQDLRTISSYVHDNPTADHIFAVSAKFGHNAQDYIGFAYMGLQEAIKQGLPIDEQYHSGYLAVNRFLSRQRAASAHEMSTEYITDKGGDIVAITTAFARIMAGNGSWTSADTDTMDSETSARLGAVLADALSSLKLARRQIMELATCNCSQCDIARNMNVNKSTVSENITIARSEIAAYIHENAREFEHLIMSIEIENSANKVIARIARGKATQAARARAYRARKRAQRERANNE